MYLKCSCISSLIGTPLPPEAGNEGCWHVGGSPDSCGDYVSHSWVEAARLAEESVTVPPRPAWADRQNLQLSLPTHPTCPVMGITKIMSTGSQGSAQHHLHAAGDVKSELLRAGAAAHPSLLALPGMALV